MEDYYKPFDRIGSSGSPGGFTDWYDKLDDTKKNALTTGLLTTGLSMMDQGGRSYDRPVSGLAVMGNAGLQGVNSYQNTLEKERRDIARNRGLDLGENYLGLAKNRDTREGTAFDAEAPYLGQRAKDETEYGGLRVGLAKSEIAKNNAMASMKDIENMDAQKKVKFQQSKDVVELVAKQLNTNLGGNLLTGNFGQMMEAMKTNPTLAQKVNDELSRPGKEKMKQAWDNAWNNIYEAMGVKSDGGLSQTASSSKNVDDFINSSLDYDFE